MRRIITAGFALALALVACKPGGGSKNPVVAKGKGIAITSDDFKARLDEQSPFIRARYTTLDRKKEFLDNLVRFEVLAHEAERQGLARDPDVQQTLKKVMVQKLVQKNFQDMSGAKDVPEADLTKYYEEHKDEYQRPRKVRLSAIVFNGTDAKKVAAAKKAVAKVKAEEAKKNMLAFGQAVAEFSEDPATKATAGDLGYKSKDELEKAYGRAFAETASALKDGEMSGVLTADKGVYVLKATGHQEELNRTFDQVKPQIQNKLFRERKTKEFDEWLKHLKEQAKITVDDKALEAIQVSAAAPPGGAGMPSMPMGGAMPMGGGMTRPMVVAPQAQPVPSAAPAPAPAPAEAPAKK